MCYVLTEFVTDLKVARLLVSIPTLGVNRNKLEGRIKLTYEFTLRKLYENDTKFKGLFFDTHLTPFQIKIKYHIQVQLFRSRIIFL